jgi:uncharacterized repeat protein (TIGR02543 family)
VKQDELEGKYIATFELNGGKLDIGSTEVNSKINYAYEPESFLIDPATYGNYKISRPGYVFTGWYKTAECNENDKWDFKTEKITAEKLTLYAGWIKEIVYTFSVCYLDGTETKTLGSYNVSAGDEFEDYRKYADERDGFTSLGYYKDAECTTPWNSDEKHPGGETDTDVKVYVDYLEGEWIIVDSYNKLLNAVGKGNIYLTADIDCEGKSLHFRNSFKSVFEGNGHKISNFTVEKTGTIRVPKCAIFAELGAGADIRNVSFEDATFNYSEVSSDSIRERKFAALAIDSTGSCTVSNVSVSGKLVTDYEGELTTLNAVLYEESQNAKVTNFTANIVIEK